MENLATPNYGDQQLERFGEALEKVKSEVSIRQYLSSRSIELRHGRSVCPIHDGADNRTSFSVDGQRWTCFACGAWGDVVDLCKRLEGHTAMWSAMISLAREFGVALPERSDRWCAWQDEKAKTKAMVRKQLARTYQRRLLKLYAPLFSVAEDSTEEELKELEELAATLWPRCLRLAERRMDDVAR